MEEHQNNNIKNEKIEKKLIQQDEVDLKNEDLLNHQIKEKI